MGQKWIATCAVQELLVPRIGTAISDTDSDCRSPRPSAWKHETWLHESNEEISNSVDTRRRWVNNSSPCSLVPDLGTRENVNCQREVKLQLGSLKGRSTLKTLQVGKASSWSIGSSSVASPPSHAADSSRGHTA